MDQYGDTIGLLVAPIPAPNSIPVLMVQALHINVGIRPVLVWIPPTSTSNQSQ